MLIEKPLRALLLPREALNTPSKAQCCLFTFTLTFLFAVFITLSKLQKNRLFFFFTLTTRVWRLQAPHLWATAVWGYQEELWHRAARWQTHLFRFAFCVLVLFLWIWIHNYLTTEDWRKKHMLVNLISAISFIQEKLPPSAFCQWGMNGLGKKFI